MDKKLLQFLAFCTICVISWVLVQSSFMDQYVKGIPNGTVAYVTNTNDELYQQIEQAAKTYNQEPVDAVIDKVWKKTPGYNGIQVNIEKSYKKMKTKGKFQEAQLIFKENSPNVHLQDLSPSPIYRANPNKPVVSFIINVAWGNEYIEGMLDTLKRHKIHATFVLEGRWVKNNPDLAKRIAAAGHELGNHSYTHPNMQQLSAAAAEKEISETNRVIQEVTGYTPKLFGPPSGSFNDRTVKVAASLGMETILWTVDTVDWKKPTPEVLTKRVLDHIHKGALILMHPTESTSKSMDILIKNIEKEYKIVPVSEAFKEERISP
ncbi:polysaccharide deacetylase family protein [Pradoshia sp. D12]|uniref:polysaccharide deacetylase family protein n=1 Tax=Bacillaceae TaxID=186817 RepID=UPI0011243A97|nr:MULTISPECIES: polysaccharide deacetylase family protein [Bacillaceae]QFK71027.1 polysaccharide deacetylase family protein [Pradoshia sp. D12]TPF72820.1 hypothetical protein FHY44_03460 [Bacillus sp. D12]